ncbi:MAG: hypothetical protein AB8G05_22465 [Oligoflexales bacterium]
MRMNVIFRILSAIPLIYLPELASSQQIQVKIKTDFNSYHSEFNELYDKIQSHSKEKLEQFEKLFSDISSEQEELNLWWDGANGFVSLSDKSKLDPVDGINTHDYFHAVRIFETKVQAIKQKISNLKIIFTANDTLDFDNSFTLQLDKILEPIYRDINNKFQEASQFNFVVQMPNHETRKIKGINLEKLGDMEVSAEQVKQLKNKENRLRAIKAGETQVITNYNRYIYRQMHTYIHSFGKSQRYRSENTEVLQLARKNLIEAFWTRSFLRKSFGMKIESFKIEYQKTWFHLDIIPAWLLAKPKIEIDGLINKDHELTISEDKGYSALSSLSGTKMKVLREEIPKRNSLAQMRSYFTGKLQELNTTAQVVALVLADIREEQQLSRQGGLKALAQSYAERYYNANEAYFRNLQSAYLKDESVEDDIFSDVDTIEDSLKGHFQLVLSALEAREQRVEEANRIKEYISSLTKNSKAKAKRAKRQSW